MISGPVSSDIQDESQSFNEFTLSSETTIPIYEGYFLGLIKKEDINYKQYVFPHALKGRDLGQLMVLVPKITDEEYGTAEITETITKMKNSTSATLIIILGQNNTPTNFINNNADFFNTKKFNEHTLIIRKQFPHEEFDSLFFIRETLGTNNFSWRQIPTTMSLEWNSRNLETVSNIRKKYFYTIPLDIITSPIQLLMVLTWGMWE